MPPDLRPSDASSQKPPLALRLRAAVPRGAKSYARSAVFTFRRLTAGLRVLPDFIIIGTQKGGTSSLHFWLGQHEAIRLPSEKEVHYFDHNHARGPLWYRAHFCTRRALRAGMLAGEASPYYLVHPHVPGRIHRLLPSVKLIALLRNPVERAISHYYHEVKYGTETLPIMDAFRAEPERIGKEWKRMLDDETYRSRAHQNFSYQQRGLYAEQLERYFTQFGRDQILVMNSDEVFQRPAAAVGRVTRFLGLSGSIAGLDATPQNVNPIDKRVPPEAIAHLEAYFAPANQRLKDLLGEDIFAAAR